VEVRTTAVVASSTIEVTRAMSRRAFATLAAEAPPSSIMPAAVSANSIERSASAPSRSSALALAGGLTAGEYVTTTLRSMRAIRRKTHKSPAP
jgi:hypothetical protein